MEGSRRRFGSPSPVIQQPRFTAQGLGVTDPRELPDEDLNRLESTTPVDGFFGILSRSRFSSLPPPINVGHIAAQTRPNPGAAEGYGTPDPAEGRPGSFSPWQVILDAARWLNDRIRTSDMGADDMTLIERGLLIYNRTRDPLYVEGTYAADLPRWAEAGPWPRAYVNRRYTLRREFEQDAQNFDGRHTLQPKHGFASTAVHRMAPPRTNRLTYRDEPTSFGSKTVSLNG